ncbi:MAG: hypothetical protein OES24_22005 [Acidimicrobiia bacterium]|nr:hypothetical protein [Acidimicrobiia bacterium]
MVELLVNSEDRPFGSIIVRKHLDDTARLAHQIRWLTRAQGPGVVRLHDVGRGAGHYSTAFGGRLTLAVAATTPESTLPILTRVWFVLERLHRLGLAHGAIVADHVVIGADGPLLLSPGGPDPEGADRGDDIASFGRMIGDLAVVWSADAVVDPSVIDRWIAVGRQITDLGRSPAAAGNDRLVTGAEVRGLLVELSASDRSGRWFRRRRRYGSSRGRRGGRRRSRS